MVSITYPNAEVGPRVTYSLPNTGFQCPSEDEMARLLRLTDAGAPWLGLAASTGLDEFGRAFRAVGYMYRRAEPDTKRSFSHFLDAANLMLQQRQGGADVSATALLAAILAHADVPWRRADRGCGQLLEVALDIHHGRPCVNNWRGLLTGERSLLPSLPPRGDRAQRAEAQRQVSFYQKTPSGDFRRMADSENMWSRSS
jgi:hypothetical protein